jgi:eukaryotic-like serine/threonine-protein kinase
MWQVGEMIGLYTLIEKLGEGQFGEVWLAEKRTPILTTKVALKLPKARVKFADVEKEAKVWEQAKGHPNVLPIVDADIHNNQIFIASEYSPDGSLDDWLKQQGGKADSIPIAVEMMGGILAGLAHLHKRQIIHRDLKPANILLQAGIPRITDFGIAKFLPSGTESNLIKGSPAYMSPEALNGDRNKQTDLWSAGVIFYQLICGELPFQGVDIQSLMYSILHRDIRPLPSQVPRHIQDIINQSFRKDISQRFQSPAEMRKALLSNRTPFNEGNEEKREFASTIPYESGLKPDHQNQIHPSLQPAQEKQTVISEKRNKDGNPALNIAESSTVLEATLPTIVRKPNFQISKPKMRPYVFEVLEVDSNRAISNRLKKQAWAFTENLGAGVLLEMVEIPGGNFLMGSPNHEPKRTGFESPQHKVTVQRFYISKFPITQMQWQTIANMMKVNRELIVHPSHCRDHALPVEQISWEDAVEFCARISKHSSKYYRLPSEAEWEYACRARTTSAFAFGEVLPSILANTREDSDSSRTRLAQTSTVGSLETANKFGLYDMHGNVYEWCSDVWHDNYKGAPTDGSSWEKDGDVAYRVQRGGSWRNKESSCRSAYRKRARGSLRNDTCGFRVVISI